MSLTGIVAVCGLAVLAVSAVAAIALRDVYRAYQITNSKYRG